MLLKGQLEEAQFENLATDPTNLPDGRAWVNTTAGRAKIAIAGGVKSVVTDDRMTAANISNAAVGNTSSTNVQNAINELQGDIDSINTTLPLKIDKSLLTTAGDMIYASAPNTPARLVNGAPGKVLKVGADGIPSWSFQAANGVNYITSGEADFGGLEKFKLFSDPVMATPPWAGDFVDGPANTGTIDGATNVAVVYNSNYAYHDYPINGSDSYIFYKKAGNQQGKGFYVDFTINHSDYGHLLEISFQYNLSTIAGNPIPDGAVKVYIQHMWSANLTPLNPNTFGAYSKDYTSTFKALYQCQKSPYPLNSTEDMRLVFYISTNAIQSYYLTFDNLSVKPATNTSSTPITDWQSYTPTVTATTTNPTFGTIAAHSASYRRVGDSAHIRYTFRQTSAGTAGSGTYLFSLPPGLSIDSAKINTNANSISNPYVMGSAYFGAGVAGEVIYSTGQTNKVTLSAGPNQFTSATATDNFGAANATIGFEAMVPIQGWSSAVTMSDQADMRQFKGRVGLSTAISPAANSAILFNSITTDSHGAYNSATGEVTINVPGFYYFTTFLNASSATTASTVYLHINGSTQVQIGGMSASAQCTGAAGVDLQAGDRVVLKCSNAITSLSTLSNFCWARMSGNATIAAAENISCSVWLTANTAVAASGIILFNAREYDSHNCFDTTSGTFTSLQAAEYEVVGYISNNTTSAMGIQIWKNGSNYKPLTIVNANGFGQGSVKIKLLPGDTITIRSQTAVTFTGAALLSAGPCALQITKVGNY